jgi:AAA domain
MLVEEAGQVLEAHILGSLVPSVEHLIMIGDPLQLRPTINNYRKLCIHQFLALSDPNESVLHGPSYRKATLPIRSIAHGTAVLLGSLHVAARCSKTNAS